MSKKIFKYQIKIAGVNDIEMPSYSQILSCQLQDDKIMMWALVEGDSDTFVMRSFSVYGTGQEIDVSKNLHISTVQQYNYVWHIFETFK